MEPADDEEELVEAEDLLQLVAVEATQLLPAVPEPSVPERHDGNLFQALKLLINPSEIMKSSNFQQFNKKRKFSIDLFYF